MISFEIAARRAILGGYLRDGRTFDSSISIRLAMEIAIRCFSLVNSLPLI